MSGCSTISACAEGEEVQNVETETVNVYVPGRRSWMIAVAPDPSTVIPPGLTVTTQPEPEGKPLNSTLPVEDVHVA